jgi:hypothetical protein
MQYRFIAILAATVAAAPAPLLGLEGTEVIDGVLPVVYVIPSLNTLHKED